MRKPNLISNWKECWKWLSVNCMVAAATLQAVWMGIPDDLRQALPKETASGITIALLALGFYGRITTRAPKPKKKAKKKSV
jgi:hypothetical protein